MENYIDQALRTERKPDIVVEHRLVQKAREVHAILGLGDEVGELCKALKAHLFYGAPLDAVNVKEEAGDVLWYLALLFDSAGLSFGEVMQANIAKLRARFPQAFTEDAANNRDLTAERAALEGA